MLLNVYERLVVQQKILFQAPNNRSPVGNVQCERRSACTGKVRMVAALEISGLSSELNIEGNATPCEFVRLNGIHAEMLSKR